MRKRAKPPVHKRTSTAPALEGYVTEQAICTLLGGIHRATLRRMEERRLFPRRRQLSPGRIGWKQSEVQVWLDNRPAVPLPTSAHNVSR